MHIKSLHFLKEEHSKICEHFGILPHVKVGKLSQQQIYKILGFLSKNFVIEANLTREVTSDLNRLTSIPCYRGYRHKLSMPLRGQRTSTNARTPTHTDTHAKSCLCTHMCKYTRNYIYIYLS